MANLNPDDSRPPFRQVEAEIRAKILNGAYSPGDRIPAYRALAEEYGVSVNTIRAAVNLLRDDGLVVIRHGQGSYVRTHVEQGGPDDDADVRARLHQLETRVAALEGKAGNR